MSSLLADLLFPDSIHTDVSLADVFPVRKSDTPVFRFAPSPTGFLHIGSVYTALINTLFATKLGGSMILRIEDTDAKRKVEGSVELIISGLSQCDIHFDEGPLGPSGTDQGSHGPYTQSHRIVLYHHVIKQLIVQGLVYPCFLTDVQLQEMRDQQTLTKSVTGVYGPYAHHRDLSLEQVQAYLDQGLPYSLRLKSHGSVTQKMQISDLIKGNTQVGERYMDTVLLKSDGVPTYHFANVVDDHYMGVTHVLRADERFATLPLHLQLYTVLGRKAPLFGHISPLMKVTDVGRSKLSKRDGEAGMLDYFAKGYPIDGLKDYLYNIINSGYEAWRTTHPLDDALSYPFDLHKLSPSGAILDIPKLIIICKEHMHHQSDKKLFLKTTDRVRNYRPDDVDVWLSHSELIIAAIGIERHTLDPKRFATYADVYDHVQMFVPVRFDRLPPVSHAALTDSVVQFVTLYRDQYHLTDTKEQRFDHLKQLGATLGYASTNAEYKTGNFQGKVGDLAMILRVALCKSPQTPDLYETMCVLGAETVSKRLEQCLLS